MYHELVIKAGSHAYKAFLQDGFYLPSVPSTNRFHKHNYAEIHVITGGNAVFHIGDHVHTTDNANVMLIPRGVFHCCTGQDHNTIHTAFQIDYPVSEFLSCQISTDTVRDFFTEIEQCGTTGNFSKIAAYIALFCSYLCRDETLPVHPVRDYGFLINEFFSKYYSNDLHLSDLANALHLSERQTERLVIVHTGNTFKEELTTIRMTVAKELLRSSDMSLGEISQYVGYHSYAGFWKAMKRSQ